MRVARLRECQGRAAKLGYRVEASASEGFYLVRPGERVDYETGLPDIEARLAELEKETAP
jgi:hypothetical protein